MNNLAPMKNCPGGGGGLQGNLNWMPGYKIIHSLKLVDYLHVQADNPWYNYYIILKAKITASA